MWASVANRLAAQFFFALAVALLFVFGEWKMLALPGLPLATMGSVIGIFLAFRTNSAYRRWWEAGTLWGGLVSASRTFGRQALTLIDQTGFEAPSVLQQRLMTLQIALITATRCHLRQQNPFPELGALLDEGEIAELRDHRHVPSALLLRKAEALREAKEAGRLTDSRWMQMDGTLTHLTELIGNCERIKATPLPRQYNFLPSLLVTMYCLVLPCGLVEVMGLLTPLASTAIGFSLVALDAVGRDLEAPFENSVHDTPITAISRNIEINLRQLFGERQIPPEVKPVDGFLY